MVLIASSCMVLEGSIKKGTMCSRVSGADRWPRPLGQAPQCLHRERTDKGESPLSPILPRASAAGKAVQSQLFSISISASIPKDHPSAECSTEDALTLSSSSFRAFRSGNAFLSYFADVDDKLPRPVCGFKASRTDVAFSPVLPRFYG
jgi:hypothetical protein